MISQDKADAKKTIRCAIYTRKSSEEGLEQEFNSLDAQYEACKAYIASQAGEGWKHLERRYDDGGISGGTLDRPGITNLLNDVDAGRVDMIVVYKIDRLTRSLTDFSKLIDRLEKAGCSFVSVTQAFNTSTSMGRLTLNVLLSFAQFEREVTSERIRDKIAASKKKGMWMGGMVPMGYQTNSSQNVRGLEVCDAEAKAIRRIYDLYEEYEDLAGVAKQIALEGIRSKRRKFKSGQEYGGCPLSHGQVHFILTNPIYIGCIRHHNEIYEGLHEAIIDRGLWNRVQSKLQTNAAKPRTRNKKSGNLQAPRNPSSLRGKIYDETGDRLTPTHTKLGSRQVRYYVSNRLLKKQTGDYKDPSGWRLPAVQLEKQVAKAIVESVRDNYARFFADPDPVKEYKAQRAGRSWIEKLKIPDADFLRSIVARIDIEPGKIQIKLAADEMASSLGLGANAIDPSACEINTRFQLKRRGVEAKLVCGELQPTPDKTLIRTMAKAHAWLKEIRQGVSAAEIGRRHSWTDSPIRQRLKMAFLSPRITELILAGKQPPDLTLQKIITNPLPLDWDSQWTALGFDQFPH